MPPIGGSTGTLRERAKHFRKALAQVDTGPLVLAPEVVELAERWGEFEAEADGLSVNGWLRRELGNGKTLAWFKRRAEAVEKLGEASRRVLHHEVAVYVLQSVPSALWELVVTALAKARLKNGRCALSMKQAERVIREIVGHSPQKKVCARCLELEAKVAMLEAKLNH